MTDRLLLDRVAADAWPALERRCVDGWLLRSARTPAGAPVTKRANSALPLVDGLPTAAQLDALAGFYRDRGLPALVQVSDPGLARHLDGLGWQALAPTTVLTGPLPDGDAALVAARPSEAWLRAHEPSDAEREVVRGCLGEIASPAGYAAVAQGGELVAIGRGVVQEGRLGVFSMAVRPSHRRRGLARQVLGALGAWAAGHGARTTYLQVEVGNDAARALYDQAGLLPAHDYHYRRRP